MSKEHQPLTHHEVYTPRGEKKIADYAGKHVREYDSYDPRLVIDLFKNGDYSGKIIADNFAGLETFIPTKLDRVELVRGHHKARLIFEVGNSILDNGMVKHEVHNSDGLIGYVFGDNLDFYIASLFHDDPIIREKAEKGQGGFDETVQKYFEKQIALGKLFDK